MNKYDDYQKEKANKLRLKMQILAVAIVIIFTLGPGTAFAYVMFDNTTDFSKNIYAKISSVVDNENSEENENTNDEDEEDFKCCVKCAKCGKTYKYNYVPDNLEKYYCTCGEKLSTSNHIIVLNTKSKKAG